MIERLRAWHAIIAFGQHTRSTDVGRGMPSSPLGSTKGRTTSGMACHHRLWAAYTVKGRRAWHASWTLDHTHGRTTSGVACHHRPWTAHMVGRRRTWHDITSLGQHTQLIDVGRGMTSLRLDCTHGRTTSGVTCHHCLWTANSVERRLVWHVMIVVGQHTRSNDVRRGMISLLLECTHGRTTSGVA